MFQAVCFFGAGVGTAWVLGFSSRYDAGIAGGIARGTYAGGVAGYVCICGGCWRSGARAVGYMRDTIVRLVLELSDKCG